MITEGQWKRWKDNSTTDDRLNTYVLSDIRQMLGEIERLREHVEELHAKMTCMCGDSVDHSPWAGHSPVSMFDHAVEQEVERRTRAMPLQDHAPELAEEASEIAPHAGYTRCGYCRAWASKPCGEGCCWEPAQPDAVVSALDALTCDQQFALAQSIAANIGYVLVKEPPHPDSPHAMVAEDQTEGKS